MSGQPLIPLALSVCSGYPLTFLRARVQYEMVTHPTLATQLQVPLLGALNEALASHQYALRLDENNPDSLFNTAQVLTSLAEEIAKTDQISDDEAVGLLQQALRLFEKCLSIQEIRYTESQDQAEIAMPEEQTEQAQDSGPSTEEQAESPPAEEQWASIIEPVTKDTLLDTALAQIATLTTLSGLLIPTHTSLLADIETHAAKLLNQTIPSYVTNDPDSPDRTHEIALAKANLTSSLLEANFRAGRIDLETYKRELSTAFSSSDLNLTTSSTSCLANATALLSFSSALADTTNNPATFSLRWQALTRASTLLTQASKIPGIASEDLISTHSLRGDIALSQHRMGQPPIAYEPATKNGPTLLANAATFYRNAGKLLAGSSVSSSEEKRKMEEVGLKAYVVALLQGQDGANAREAIEGVSKDGVKDRLTDMVDEGLIDAEVGEQIWASLQ